MAPPDVAETAIRCDDLRPDSSICTSFRFGRNVRPVPPRTAVTCPESKIGHVLAIPWDFSGASLLVDRQSVGESAFLGNDLGSGPVRNGRRFNPEWRALPVPVGIGAKSDRAGDDQANAFIELPPLIAQLVLDPSQTLLNVTENPPDIVGHDQSRSSAAAARFCARR